MASSSATGVAKRSSGEWSCGVRLEQLAVRRPRIYPLKKTGETLPAIVSALICVMGYDRHCPFDSLHLCASTATSDPL